MLALAGVVVTLGLFSQPFVSPLSLTFLACHASPASILVLASVRARVSLST